MANQETSPVFSYVGLRQQRINDIKAQLGATSQSPVYETNASGIPQYLGIKFRVGKGPDTTSFFVPESDLNPAIPTEPAKPAK